MEYLQNLAEWTDFFAWKQVLAFLQHITTPEHSYLAIQKKQKKFLYEKSVKRNVNINLSFDVMDDIFIFIFVVGVDFAIFFKNIP